MCICYGPLRRDVYADIGYAHDGRFERSVEVQFHPGAVLNGCLQDRLKLGYRVW